MAQGLYQGCGHFVISWHISSLVAQTMKNTLHLSYSGDSRVFLGLAVVVPVVMTAMSVMVMMRVILPYSHYNLR
jgi:hypothetical protein